jgi:hypothetical protein
MGDRFPGEPPVDLIQIKAIFDLHLPPGQVVIFHGIISGASIHCKVAEIVPRQITRRFARPK